MLGSRWLKNYLYAFAAESWLIAALSAAVGFYGDYPGALPDRHSDAAVPRLLLPYLIWRIIRRLDVDREIHVILQPSSSLVIGAFVVMFALAVSSRSAGELHLELTVAVLALTVMLSMKLIGFLMLAVRHEAISQILGLLVLENGIFLGAQILVPGMPLLIEIVILFDLLIVVACFGVLVRLPADACRHDQQPRTQAAGGLMIGALLLALSLAPLAALVGCLIAQRRPALCEALNLVASAYIVRMRAAAARSLSAEPARLFWGDYVVIDRARAWVILCAAIVYLLASIYAVGYMRLLEEDERLFRLLRAVRRLRR